MGKGKKAKIGRNDLCCCGSGKKYKKCCLNAGPISMPAGDLCDAAHEWGTAAFFLPSTRWHVGLMDFENCPICRGVPQGVLPAEYVKDTRGHSRNETEKWPGHTAAEVTLMNLAWSGRGRVLRRPDTPGQLPWGRRPLSSRYGRGFYRVTGEVG